MEKNKTSVETPPLRSQGLLYGGTPHLSSHHSRIFSLSTFFNIFTPACRMSDPHRHREPVTPAPDDWYDELSLVVLDTNSPPSSLALIAARHFVSHLPAEFV